MNALIQQYYSPVHSLLAVCDVVSIAASQQDVYVVVFKFAVGVSVEWLFVSLCWRSVHGVPHLPPIDSWNRLQLPW